MFVRKGFAATLIGTAVGALLLGSLGALGFLIPCETRGLECLGVAIVGVILVVIGATLGSLLGCYLGLRLARHERAGRTTVMLVLVEVGVAVLGGVSGGVLPEGSGIPLLLWGPGLLGLPLLARWLALRGVPAVES